MSVINEMLRDLEKNKHANRASHHATAAREKNNNFLKFIIVILSIVVIFLVYKEFISDHRKNVKKEANKNLNIANKPLNATRKITAITPQKNSAKITANITSQTQHQIELKPAQKSNTHQHDDPNKTKATQRKIEQKNTLEQEPHQMSATAEADNGTALNAPEISAQIKDENSSSETSQFLIKKQKKNPEQEARRLWREAQRNPANAEKLLLNALELDPALSGARLQLIAYGVASKNIEMVNAVLSDGLNRDPENVDFIEWKARLLIVANNYREALSWLNKKTPDIHSHTRFYGLLAGVQSHLHDFKMAEETYQLLTTTEPDNGAWILGLAIAQQKQGKNDAAKTSYQRAYGAKGLNQRSKQFIQQQLNSMVQ